MKQLHIFLFLFAAISLLFTDCRNEPSSSTNNPAQRATNSTAPAHQAASAEGSPEDLAARSCACYKDLTDLRLQARKEYEAGDTLAYQRSDFDLLEERKKAKACVKAIMESIKSDPPVKDAFQEALLTKCPKYATSILLMNKVNWKATE